MMPSQDGAQNRVDLRMDYLLWKLVDWSWLGVQIDELGLGA